MKRKFGNLIFFLISIIFSLSSLSCSTSTTLTSWKDPNLKEKTFSKILVFGFIKDLEYRTEFENTITKLLKQTGIEAVPSLKLISPVKKYSKDDLEIILSDGNFDGMLTIKYEGNILEISKRNGTTYYKYYRRYNKHFRRKAYIETHKTVIMECRLFSVQFENDVWVATSKTSDASSTPELVKSVAGEIIKSLKKNKLIK